MMKLQRAKEQNDRLDAENRALRERVRFLSEKTNLLDQVGQICMSICMYKFLTLQQLGIVWFCVYPVGKE